MLYDPSKVTYEQLLDTFWHQINPTQTVPPFALTRASGVTALRRASPTDGVNEPRAVLQDQQFCDRGKQYRSAIFYHNESQRRAAEASKVKYAASGVFGTGFLGGPRQLVSELSVCRKLHLSIQRSATR